MAYVATTPAGPACGGYAIQSALLPDPTHDLRRLEPGPGRIALSDSGPIRGLADFRALPQRSREGAESGGGRSPWAVRLPVDEEGKFPATW